MFELHMNDMRAANIEAINPVILGETKAEIIAYLEDEKAPAVWEDGKWRKTYKKDSPLEWYNEPFVYEGTCIEDAILSVPNWVFLKTQVKQNYITNLHNFPIKLGGVDGEIEKIENEDL